MRVTKFIALLVVIIVTVASCGPASQKGNVKKATKKSLTQLKVPESWVSKSKNYEDLSIKWLKSFNDPMMLKLIKEGKSKNLDLQVAAGNMNKAWLLAKKSSASLKPTADLAVGREQSGSKNSGSSGKVSVGLTVSWELDVWGRISSGVSASKASAQAIEADYVFAQHSLSANIAKSYLKVVEAKLQTAIARKNQAILTKTLRITQVKFKNGMSSGQDVAVNRASLASAKEQVINLEGSQRDALRALEVLLGRYPKAALETPKVLPKLPLQPPAGIPSKVLERRPDIVSAERNVAVAFNNTAQAKAARLPQFSLTTTVSGASSSLSSALNPSNAAWKLGANLLTPIFDGGKRKLDVKIAKVEQKQAILGYAKAALVAFSEVEKNLDQGRILSAREKALRDALKHRRKAYRIAKIRYKEGESNLLDTLTIQQQAITAESNLLSVRRLQLEQRINLYLSLGGSW